VASDAYRNLDLDGLAAFAGRLATALRPGDVVGLRGDLGSGKTTLVRALVAALHGSDAAVSSPTFIFHQSYPGEPPIEHLDLYRIEDPAQALDLGLEDALRPGAIALVEWPEVLPGFLPLDAWLVEIHGSGSDPRMITVSHPSRSVSA
jgi:tRNA threonylcarbamoyl adenosine modification protein YjeE